MATHIDDTTCSPCASSIASSASQNKPRAVPGMSLTFELTVLGHSSVSSISSPGTLASRIGASIGLPHSSFSPTFPHSSTTADPPAPDVDTHAPCFVVSTAAHILAAAVRTHSGVDPCGSTWLTTSEISLPRWCESLGRSPGWRGENMASIALVSSVVGSSERNLANLFASARAAAPCVLFLDGLESLVARAEQREQRRLSHAVGASYRIDAWDGQGHLVDSDGRRTARVADVAEMQRTSSAVFGRRLRRAQWRQDGPQCKRTLGSSATCCQGLVQSGKAFRV